MRRKNGTSKNMANFIIIVLDVLRRRKEYNIFIYASKRQKKQIMYKKHNYGIKKITEY